LPASFDCGETGGRRLSADDPRWYAFGFRRPVDARMPEQVEALDLRTAAVGEVIAEWPKADRAENYRVAWKVAGSDAELTEVGLVADPKAIITGVPPGATIVVMVTAHNAAGESARTEKEIALPEALVERPTPNTELPTSNEPHPAGEIQPKCCEGGSI
jgi:hypothetical protein